VAAFALTLGACGGSAHDASSTATHASVSRPATTAVEAAFISRADVICRKLDAVLDLEKPRSDSRGEVAKLVPGRVELEQRSVAALKRLKAPAALAATWREMLRLRAALARELNEYGHAVAAGDTAAVTALTQSKARTHQRLGTVGRAAGFDECSAIR
jgi:hypothetical protein